MGRRVVWEERGGEVGRVETEVVPAGGPARVDAVVVVPAGSVALLARPGRVATPLARAAVTSKERVEDASPISSVYKMTTSLLCT